MLRWLGDRAGDGAAHEGAERIEAAVRAVVGAGGVGTPDLGGAMTSGELGARIVEAL